MSVNDGRKPHRNREPWPSDRVPTNDLQRLIASAPLNEDAASGFREGRNAQPESAPASTAASEQQSIPCSACHGRGIVRLPGAGKFGCGDCGGAGQRAASEQQASVSELPPLPHTTYNGYSDGSEPLWTKEQMHDYANAAVALCARLAATPDIATTAADQQGDTASAELLAAADAVVERWHSRDWKQPHTADFIARLTAAVGAAKFQQGAAQPPQSDPKTDPKSPQSEGAAQAQAGESRDAARYRWLRDNGVLDDDGPADDALLVYKGFGESSLLPGQLDEAVDAAMSAPATSNGGKA